MTARVYRLFVEKKPGYDIEASILYNDLKEFLEIKGLEQTRIVHRYDVQGISGEDFEQAKKTIFAEPPVDRIYEEKFDYPEEAKIIAIEYLPGQYDQRADSAAQCVQILSQGEKPEIRCAKIIILTGDLSKEDYIKAKDYCINPLDSREADLEKPDSLEIELEYPDGVEKIEGFTGMSVEDLKKFLQEKELAMSEDDLLFIQQYYREEEREPTITEIRVLDTYWSDHCRHTTFNTDITDIEFEDGYYTPAIREAYQQYLKTRQLLYQDKEKKICLMDIATIGMKEMKKRGLLDDLEESEEINAASIEVSVEVDGKKEKWLVMFKNETHNHPTEIEPFGGAATCLGGAIRDPLSGRSYVYQAMRVTGSGDPRTPVAETMPGKLPQRKITTEAAEGFSSYGNQIGLATGEVKEFYHNRFLAKRMEIGAVIAAAPAENVIRESPSQGDLIVLVGGRTGRDGCGGATGSSKKHTEKSLDKCGAEVQKGNPPTERKIQRLFRRPEVSKLIKKCNDFGAGGVAVAVGELADSLDIDLDAVPKKYEGLDGTELAISESQERMAVLLDPDDIKQFIQFSLEENLEATIIAKVTDSGRLRMSWQGDKIVDLSRDFLKTHGAEQQAQVKVADPEKDSCYLNRLPVESVFDKQNPEKAWLDNMRRLNVCSQKGLRERFDSTIGAGTVLLPYGGKNQLTPVSGMVARIPVLDGETTTGTIMTFGYNPDLAVWSPFHGAVYAVVEAVARSVALGGDYQGVRLALQEYFEKLGDNPEKWGKPFSALLGAYLVQNRLGIPAIGGKDSMSGSFKDMDVPPNLIAFAVNTTDIRRTVSPEFKEEGNKVIWVRLQKDEYDLPDFADLKGKFSSVFKLIKAGQIKSISCVDTGGAAAALSKMAFGNSIGVELDNQLDLEKLFLPEHGSFIIEIDNEIDQQILPDHIILGNTIEEEVVKYKDMELPLQEIRKNWQSTLADVFPTKTEQNNEQVNISDFKKSKKNISILKKKGKPGVLIPIFPGTNCEYDSAQKFKKAGARVETLVFKNLNPGMIEDSIQLLVKEIDKAQIVMIPGGFSAGDEPEGSGKFIAAVFRNPEVKEAVNRLLKERDGLMLGICNGFQALIKLGLLPYGEIKPLTDDSPTLTFNTLGRHVSCMIKSRVVSNLSPWLANVEVGDEHWIPVSHGEGRFVADKSIIKRLAEKGQIATQYVDLAGNATYDIKHNPNGSMMAVEGITSPDGRIFGKMAHSERITANTAINIPGNKNQGLFSAGVSYFKL